MVISNQEIIDALCYGQPTEREVRILKRELLNNCRERKQKENRERLALELELSLSLTK